MSARDWVTLDVKEILKETEKAFLLHLEDDTTLWVPFSQISDADEYGEGDKNLEMDVTAWFMDKTEQMP
jgi:hypothetical protein